MILLIICPVVMLLYPRCWWFPQLWNFPISGGRMTHSAREHRRRESIVCMHLCDKSLVVHGFRLTSSKWTLIKILVRRGVILIRWKSIIDGERRFYNVDLRCRSSKTIAVRSTTMICDGGRWNPGTSLDKQVQIVDCRLLATWNESDFVFATLYFLLSLRMEENQP